MAKEIILGLILFIGAGFLIDVVTSETSMPWYVVGPLLFIGVFAAIWVRVRHLI